MGRGGEGWGGVGVAGEGGEGWGGVGRKEVCKQQTNIIHTFPNYLLLKLQACPKVLTSRSDQQGISLWMSTF